MSHELTGTDAMFSVREMPWHRLGTVLDDYPTRAEAQPMVHGWEPQAVEMYYKWPVVTETGDILMEERKVESSVLNLRDDNGDELAAVSRTLETVSNNTLWDIGETIQGSGVDVKYETGGSLGGGKKVWLMLTLDHPLFVNGDKSATMHYYLLQNDHTGGGSFKGSATATRVVCANTLRMADIDAQAHGTEFTFRHSVNIHDRIEEARAALAGWRESVEAWSLFTEHMMDQKVSPAGVREFLTRFIPEPVGHVVSDRVRTNIEEARGQWMSVYNSVTGEGIDGTAYGLLQASSEYSEHVRKAHNAETKFRRAILKPNRIMTTAKNLALEAALV